MWPLSRVVECSVLLAVASAPFAVVGALRMFPGLPITLMFLWVACGVLLVWLLSGVRFFIPLSGRLVLGLVFLPFLLALSVGLSAAVSVPPLGIDYSSYPSLAVGRVVNFVALALFFVGTLTLIPGWRDTVADFGPAHQVVWIYWFATGVFVLFAIWQFFHFYTGLPYPFPETRTHVHSVPDALKGLVPGRLTGLADEPSFLVPFVLDFALLSVLFVRGFRLFILLAASAVVVLLSFSVGGYLNALIIISALMVTLILKAVAHQRVNLKHVLMIAAVFLTVSAVLFFTALPYLELVTARITSALDPDRHARAFMVLMPFYWLGDSTLLSILFGHGPKSYAMLGQVVALPTSGHPVHVTSNNLFTDVVWEHGIVGLSGLIVLFGALALKTRVFLSFTRERLVAFLLLVHLFASSLYRGDFYSLRFIVILLVVIFLIEGLVSGRDLRPPIGQFGAHPRKDLGK